MAMSKEHKEALVRGRREASAIKAYLNAIATKRPGRPVTKDSLNQRLGNVNEKIKASNDPLKTVDLIQTRLEIEKALKDAEDTNDISALETDFIEHAASYSVRKGLTYSAWRQIGVPASVLKSAGIPETRRR